MGETIRRVQHLSCSRHWGNKSPATLPLLPCSGECKGQALLDGASETRCHPLVATRRRGDETPFFLIKEKNQQHIQTQGLFIGRIENCLQHGKRATLKGPFAYGVQTIDAIFKSLMAGSAEQHPVAVGANEGESPY